MNQTAINLIAVSVFLMTFSALLGPVVHLSPIFPAAATITLLGIATLDNFRFQGRGGTIIIDWLARFSPAYSDRIIRHEAGHFLAATLLNIPVTGYTLSAWEAWRKGQPGQGGVTFDDSELAKQLPTGKITAQLLDRYCTIWMAGIAAEILVFNSAEGGNDDQNKLAEVLQSLGFSETAYQQKLRFHLLQAKNLIQANWSSYQGLVQAMQERLTVAECQQLITKLNTQNSAINH